MRLGGDAQAGAQVGRTGWVRKVCVRIHAVRDQVKLGRVSAQALDGNVA